MYARKRIYNRLKRIGHERGNALSLFDFYSEVMTTENIGCMIEHFRSIVENIIEEGTAIPVSEQQMAKRKALGLPDLSYDSEEIKILARGCSKALEE